MLKKEQILEAYCVKCRAKREIKDAKAITMKNGKPATQGTCPVCGTKMFRIGKGQVEIIYNTLKQEGLDVPMQVHPVSHYEMCNKDYDDHNDVCRIML